MVTTEINQATYHALRTSAAWINLTERGKVRVTGEDAGRLLHAMTTNHVKELASGAGLYAFFLNDKGRILADANIFRLGDDFWIDCESQNGPKIHHLLDRYIIADDAESKDETALWFCVGIEGPDSPRILAEMGLPVPERQWALEKLEWGHIARVASTGPVGFRIWASDTGRQLLWEKLERSNVPQVLGDEARLVRLENGIPRYGEEISERYLVQETGLTHAVHANKGCYLGQEIVERVRSRGQVHRLLKKIRISGSLLPGDGATLLDDRTAVGQICSSAYSPDLGEGVGFAYIRTETIERRPDLLVEGSDPAMHVRVA